MTPQHEPEVDRANIRAAVRRVDGISDTFHVGRYHCAMTLKGGALQVEFQPSMPRKMTTAMWRQYRRGRDAFLARLGVPVMVVEP